MIPYREKTLVLCYFEYTGRLGPKTRRLRDSVMLEVEFSDQLLDIFDRYMVRQANDWNWMKRNRFEYRPLEWKLLRYLTADGRKAF